MNEKHEEIRQQIIDRYQNATYGLWNALLTINGIILAATSLTQSSINFSINLTILILAFIAIGLLTHNYLAIKQTYYKIGQVISDDPENLTDEIKENDIKVSISRSNRVQCFEKICLFILCVQSVLIITGFTVANV